MAKAVIEKVSFPKKARFFFNDSFLGTSEYQHGFFMKEILIYQHDTLLYRFKETDRVIWVLRNCLYLISFVLQIFLCPKYTIFDGKEEIIGNFQKNRFGAARIFTMYNNQYHLFTHKNNSFSLIKDGKQIALYKKGSLKWLECCPDTYDIYYSSDEPVEIIGLFCLIIDLMFFTDCGGRTITEVIVLHDPHPEYAAWRPEE